MGSDSKGEEKPVVEKWKKGERMIDGHSGVAECGATERQRRWRAFFFFFFFFPPHTAWVSVLQQHPHLRRLIRHVT